MEVTGLLEAALEVDPLEIVPDVTDVPEVVVVAVSEISNNYYGHIK